MKIYPSLFATFVIAILAIATPIRAEDVAGASDHPLVKRVTGSEIFFSKKTDFDRLKLALSKIEWNGAEMKVNPYESTTVEG